MRYDEIEDVAPFGDARDAIRWADNYLLKPDCKTITGKIMQDNVEQLRDVIGDKAYSQGLAVFISSALAGGKRPNCYAVRLVYGRGESYRIEMAEMLAHAVWKGPAEDKTIAKAIDVAHFVVEHVKQKERYGKRLPMTIIANELGISRQYFYTLWRHDVGTMRELFMHWLDSGMREVEQRLIDAGVVG